MGANCNCCYGPNNQSEMLVGNSRNPKGTTTTRPDSIQDIHSNFSAVMIAPIKAIYEKILAGDGHSIKEIRILWKQLDETNSMCLAHALHDLSHLRELTLKDNGLNLSTFRNILAELTNCTGLSKLSISGNSLGNPGIKSLIEVLPVLTNLEELALEDNHLGDSSLRYLSEVVPNMKNLKLLWLQKNKFKRDTVIEFSEQLSTIRSFRELNIDINDLSDDDVVTIQRNIKKVVLNYSN